MKWIVKGNSMNRERKNGVERPGRHQQSVDGVGGRVAVFTPFLTIFFFKFFWLHFKTPTRDPHAPAVEAQSYSLDHHGSPKGFFF